MSPENGTIKKINYGLRQFERVMRSEWSIHIEKEKCPYLNVGKQCVETGTLCDPGICPRKIEFVNQ